MKTQTQYSFKLYWSPTGQHIATVTAANKRAAIRKAPKPYRTYLGEIYAVPENPRSYIAVITSTTMHTLLGGSRKHVSSRFETADMARAFARQSIDANIHTPCTFEIVPSEQAPEITSAMLEVR